MIRPTRGSERVRLLGVGPFVLSRAGMCAGGAPAECEGAAGVAFSYSFDTWSRAEATYGIGEGPATRVSLSLPEGTAEAIRARVGKREFSAFIAEAVERELRGQVLDEYVADCESRKGPVSDPARQRARQVVDDDFAATPGPAVLPGVHRLLTTGGVDECLVRMLERKPLLFDAHARRSAMAEATPDAVDVSDTEPARRIVEEEQARLGFADASPATPG